MPYSERAFAGPDFFGRVFVADYCAHCATRDEHKRIKGIEHRALAAIRGR